MSATAAAAQRTDRVYHDGGAATRVYHDGGAATRVSGSEAKRVCGSEAKQPMAVQLGESVPRRPPRPHAPRIRLPSLAHLPVDSHGRSTASIDNLNMNETGLGGCGGPFPRTPPRRLPSAFPTSESFLAYCLVPLPPPPTAGPCGGALNFSSTDCQYTRRHTGHLPRKLSESSAGRGTGPVLGAYCTVRPESGTAGPPPLVPPAPRRAAPCLPCLAGQQCPCSTGCHHTT